MNTGVELIATERQRQKMGEGWTDAHDDEHENGEMAIAAACYASPVSLRAERSCHCGNVSCRMNWGDPWPWDEKLGNYILDSLAVFEVESANGQHE